MSVPSTALFGSPVLIRRGGHASPKPGQFRLVQATYIGACGHEVTCRLEQDDPDDTVGWNKRGMVGRWSRSVMFPNDEVSE